MKYNFKENKTEIKKSIAHWRRLLKLAEKGKWREAMAEGWWAADCPLCAANPEDWGEDDYSEPGCWEECPLNVIGQGCCEDGPWGDARDTLENQDTDLRPVRKMLKTLEGLLKYC